VSCAIGLFTLMAVSGELAQFRECTCERRPSRRAVFPRRYLDKFSRGIA